jgi:hypothetical protein
MGVEAADAVGDGYKEMAARASEALAERVVEVPAQAPAMASTNTADAAAESIPRADFRSVTGNPRPQGRDSRSSRVIRTAAAARPTAAESSLLQSWLRTPLTSATSS